MNASQLLKRLAEAAKDEDDFPYELEDIVRELPDNENGLDLLPTIFQFMEQHPSLDFGAPGALVHHAERFYRNGYEELLLESISRHPVVQTTIMLTRLINGADEPNRRNELIALLRNVSEHRYGDEDTRQLAEEFLDHYANL